LVFDLILFEMTERYKIIMPYAVIQNVLKRTNVRKFLIYFGQMTEMFQRKNRWAGRGHR